MSGPMTHSPQELSREELLSAAGVCDAVAAADFSNCSATLIGWGRMGKQYAAALEALGVRRIRVVGRSDRTLEPLRSLSQVEVLAGGFEAFSASPRPDELGIVAVPMAGLLPAAKKLLSLGFRKILIEKPIALNSGEIETLAKEFEESQALGICAYNRVAYPSFLECRSRVAQEGGATSCAYTFTEIISPDWERAFPEEELARWGIANSLHPIGMAHALIGTPAQWSGFRKGALRWHPSGAVFAGSGISERGIPFSYHADWGSTGRWSVEIHTASSSYRLCPLETLARRVDAKGEWVEVPLKAFAPQVKPGFVEQTAALLNGEIGRQIPLVTLSQAAALAKFAEGVFGYEG